MKLAVGLKSGNVDGPDGSVFYFYVLIFLQNEMVGVEEGFLVNGGWVLQLFLKLSAI